MHAKPLVDLADQLYDLSEHVAGGDHNLKAAAANGSFNAVAFLEALAAALPVILSLLKPLLGQSTVTPAP